MNLPSVSRRVLRLAATGGLVALLSACYVVPVGGYRGGPYESGPMVESGPPAPQYEVVPAPILGHIWIGGYWTWQLGRHLWIGGRWAVPPSGQHWTPHRWERGSRGWHERPGHWSHRRG